MDFSKLLKDLPAMMSQAKGMQEKLQALRVEGSAGGGMVRVTLNGTGDLVKIDIEREVVDPEDVEMLQDLILAACADGKKRVAQEMQGQMREMTGGMDLSGLGINLPGMGG